MPVTPYCKDLFQSRRDLHQFLSACKQSSIEKNHAQIISISLEIEPVDPLAVYHQLARADQLSCYFEKHNLNHDTYLQHEQKVANKPSELTGIAAIGSVVQVNLKGRDRFAAAQDFIQATLASTVTVGDVNCPLSGPHFFCGFTFFDDAAHPNSAFSGGLIFLPAWQISHHNDCCTVVANLIVDANSRLEFIGDKLWKTFQDIKETNYELLNPVVDNRHFLNVQDVTHTRHFKQAVNSVLRSIQAGILNKIVLAHAVDIFSPLPFHPVHSLHNLRKLYPDCHIFAFSNGKGQHFVGASPERLVSLQNRQLITDALAGSAPRGKTTSDDAHLANGLLSSAKEMHEHRVVLDFITRRLCQLGLSPQPLPLRLRQLSNIQHLHTPIQATVPANIHLLDAIAELHPTPAVAGVPTEIACAYIRRYEAFERSLYAAPIGWVDHQGNGEFAVGIRSALIDGCHARLYAGAGIVAGSDPDRELAEVQLKLQALLSALV
jgi:menaquinone-specific isochorismate synthase